MDDALRVQVATEVEGAMRSFEQAERARDAETLIAHFAAIPAFHMYSDGTRLSFDQMTGYVRETFPKLRSLEGGFIDLNVIALAPDAALAAGTSENQLPTFPATPRAFTARRRGCGGRSTADG